MCGFNQTALSRSVTEEPVNEMKVALIKEVCRSPADLPLGYNAPEVSSPSAPILHAHIYLQAADSD